MQQAGSSAARAHAGQIDGHTALHQEPDQAAKQQLKENLELAAFPASGLLGPSSSSPPPVRVWIVHACMHACRHLHHQHHVGHDPACMQQFLHTLPCSAMIHACSHILPAIMLLFCHATQSHIPPCRGSMSRACLQCI